MSKKKFKGLTHQDMLDQAQKLKELGDTFEDICLWVSQVTENGPLEIFMDNEFIRLNFWLANLNSFAKELESNKHFLEKGEEIQKEIIRRGICEVKTYD